MMTSGLGAAFSSHKGDTEEQRGTILVGLGTMRVSWTLWWREVELNTLGGCCL